MPTYTRWKNAHPRDYKIRDWDVLLFLLQVAITPAAVLHVWALALYEAGRLVRRRHFLRALAYALLTPVFCLGEAPHYFRARWNNITG